jgi:DNA-binding transcriptional ArsR family regulator
MKRRREKVTRLNRDDQLDGLASPVRLEIVDCLQRHGALSIAELARHLGRSAGSLYRHVHRLLEVGVLVEKGRRRAGRRYESIYAVVPGAFGMDFDPDYPRSGEFVKRFAGAILRLAERDFNAAIDRGDAVTRGPNRNVTYHRRKARLTREGLTRLVKHLEEAVQIIIEENEKGQGRYYVMTAFLTPLREANDLPD